MTGIGFPARLRVSHQSRTLNKNYRRNGKLQSCEPCRKGKLRCDHMMPACGRCTRRNKTEQCVYHPAPLTKAATIPTPEPSEPTSSVATSQDLNPATSTVLSFTPFENTHAPSSQARFSRASSLPAQSSNNGPLCLDELRTPLQHNSATEEPMRFNQSDDFISHSAFLAENESSIGLLPLPRESNTASQTKIPQSQIDKGALVLALLKDLPTFDIYMARLLSLLRGIVVIEPMLKGWSAGIWSTWRKTLEAQKPDGLREMSAKVWENTKKPLSRLLHRQTKPSDFVEETTGEGLRWEIVGIILTMVGILCQSLQDGDSLFCSHDDEPVDRAALTVKMFNASEACVDFCKNFDIINDLFMWLLYEQTILACSLHSKGSYFNWQRTGYLCQALMAFGLHQKIEVNDHTPFFISEFRKRVFILTYNNDKYSSMFVGRPPRLTRQYCLIQLPLDLTDAQIMSHGFALDYALNTLDQDGWNQQGLVQASTFARVYASNALITEEILEISIGQLPDEEILKRATDIETRADQFWENLPEFLKPDSQHPFEIKRAPIELLFLAYIKFDYLGHHFLLQRTLIKKFGADSSKLLAVSQEILQFMLHWVNHREIFRDFQLDFTSMMCIHIPAVAVVAVELLHQEQDPTSVSALTSPLPRSETIQELSVLVACLGRVKPDSGAYSICDRGRRFLKKVLDTILSPTRQEVVTNTPNADRLTDTTSLDVPLFQTGNDGDFMRWLESMDWEKDSWVNFT